MDGCRSRRHNWRMSDRIDKLKDAIETMHKCAARFVESVPVIELFRGELAWDGVVEVFDLTVHPRAKRCYAWFYVDDAGERQYTDGSASFLARLGSDRPRDSAGRFTTDRRKSGDCQRHRAAW
jgi:hypothetical protein